MKFLIVMISSLFLTGCHQISIRGCCSSHGGVCDIHDNKVICCDETISPGCMNRKNKK